MERSIKKTDCDLVEKTEDCSQLIHCGENLKRRGLNMLTNCQMRGEASILACFGYLCI